MLFSNTDHRKQHLTEEIDKLNKEYASKVKEYDILCSELESQRRAKRVVCVETVKTESQLGDMNALFIETFSQLSTIKIDYHKITDKQLAKIKETNLEISEKISELDEYNKKELIDIDGLNLKYKTEINDKLSDVAELEGHIVHMEKRLAEFELYKTKESQKQEKLGRDNRERQSALRKKDIKLSLKEKRLDRLALDLK
jgi:hypothetical protein